MNLNALADEILTYLQTKHARVYRNKAPQSPTFPYVIYRVESVTNSYPSEDFYVNIDVYESTGTSVRTIEDLADSIDAGINRKVINTLSINAHFERETRQFVPAQELVGAQMINLRYSVRTYFK